MPAPTGAGFEWEYFHVNSAEITPDGNFLISARNTSGGLQDRPPHGQDHLEAGRQGVDLQARQGRALRLAAQRPPAGRRHDQHLRQLGRAADAQDTRACSTIRLDEQAKTATLVRAFKHPLGLLSASQGNVETLPNGNLFVGWGSQRWFTEFDAQGNVVFDGRLARGNDNYRAFRYPWAGRPVARRRRWSRPPTRQGHRPRELERRDRGRSLGAARRPEWRRAGPDRLRAATAASRPR